MQPVSYARHHFPPDVIRRAVWLYLRFTLSYRDVEELLAERGLDVSYETTRRWVLKFGPAFARNLRRLRSRPTGRWHLDEMVILSANSPERGAEGDPCSPPSIRPALRSSAQRRQTEVRPRPNQFADSIRWWSRSRAAACTCGE